MTVGKSNPEIAILGDSVFFVDQMTPTEIEWLYRELKAQDDRERIQANRSIAS